jgi:hypothetical protein
MQFPEEERDFSLLHSVETSYGADTASYLAGIGALSLGVKWPRREADHSTLSSAKVKKGGAITPLVHTSSWRYV